MSDPHIRTCIRIGRHGARVEAWLPDPLHEIALEMLTELEADLQSGDTHRATEILGLLAGLLVDASTLIITPDLPEPSGASPKPAGPG